MQGNRTRTIIAAALLAGWAAAPALADVKAGVDAWKAGSFEAAVTEWRPIANRGDADAQFNMGQAYKLGRGVPADLAIARSWYEKAAAQGHEQAQSNLGLILFQAGDRKAAMYWIKKAADRGDPRAQYVLGTALFNGDGVAKDWPRAYALMTRSAAQGLPQAASSLARMDEHMLAPDRQKGVDLARQMEVEPAATDDAIVLASSRPPAAAVKAAAVAKPAIKVAAPPAPKTKPPVRMATTTRPVAAIPGGRWRVQLGAFDSPAAARSKWAVLARSMPALSGLQPSYEAFGALTRLRVGPLAGKADADRLCGAAKAAGQACFAVRP